MHTVIGPSDAVFVEFDHSVAVCIDSSFVSAGIGVFKESLCAAAVFYLACFCIYLAGYEPVFVLGKITCSIQIMNDLDPRRIVIFDIYTDPPV